MEGSLVRRLANAAQTDHLALVRRHNISVAAFARNVLTAEYAETASSLKEALQGLRGDQTSGLPTLVKTEGSKGSRRDADSGDEALVLIDSKSVLSGQT